MLQPKDLKGTDTSASTMPNFSGNWKIIRSENFEDLLKVLGKEIFESRGERRGHRGLGGGYEKGREAGIRAWGAGGQHPQE